MELNEIELKDVPSVGPTTARKLQEAGIISVVDLAVCSVQELCDRINCTKPTASKMIFEANKLLREEKFLEARIVTASELKEEREKYPLLKTGSEELDTLLKGGIEIGAITEFYGQYGSGKTQLCMTLSVIATQLTNKGGVDGNVYYIDTENSFKKERVIEICKERELDPESVMNKIHVSRVRGSTEFDYALLHMNETVRDYNIKLIIIDGLMTQYRAEFEGRGTLGERQQRMNRMLNNLKKTIEISKLFCVVTNQILTDPGMMFGDPTRAVGGNIVGHAMTYRIYLKKSGKNRIARMEKSSKHPTGETMFRIDEKGVTDIEK